MKPLEITILPEDFKYSPRGYTYPACVLEIALKRIYPGSEIHVYYQTVSIDSKRYTVDTTQWGDGTAIDGFTSEGINDCAKKAKLSLAGIPSKTLYLQPLEEVLPTFSGPMDPRVC